MLIEASGGVSAKSRRLKRLRCAVQDYGWGRIGSDAVVARLHAANSGTDVDESQPYAELWMGTHECGPSYVVRKCVVKGFVKDVVGETLKDLIVTNPNVVGDVVLHKWGCHLPFLFKVLSIAKPLSIQAHPDKVLARQLHKMHPSLYKDDNHKPEMALALTEFEALCGFLEIKELKSVLRRVHEIGDLVGHEYVNQVLVLRNVDEKTIKAAVKSLFTQVMFASKDLVCEVLSKLKKRLNMEDELTEKEQLVLRLEEEYPNDVGVIAAFFMNYVKLEPGEALYLEANELHAYISGDCVECMATSDNVVRAGLTPKKRDVKTLCSMLSYNLGFPKTMKGIAVNKWTKRYRPPLEEFEVDRCILPKEASVSFPAIPSPSIFVIMEGNGTISSIVSDHEYETIAVGDVLFTPANAKVIIKSTSRLELYRAGVNSGSFYEVPW